MGAEYRLGNGTIRRSKSEKGAPYWGRLRITPQQLATLIAWSDQNTPQSYHDEIYWELDIAAWLRDGQEGEKFFSLVIEEPYKSQKVEVGSVPMVPGRGPAPQPAPAPAPTPAPAPAVAAAAPVAQQGGLDLDRTPF